MSRRVFVAGLFHETHTFLSTTTGMASFRAGQYSRGQQVIERNQGKGSPMAGFLTYAQEAGWQVVPGVYTWAMPSGTVEQEVVDSFLADLRRDLAGAGQLDGVFLVLHGAMVSSGCHDVEGAVIRAARESCDPRLPLCGVLDLHGNYTEAMAAWSDCFVSYRENPHTDAVQAAHRAAAILDRIMQDGRRPRSLRVHPPLMFSPRGTASAAPPMAAVLSRARQIEREHPEVLVCNVFGGFSYADVPDVGFSVGCSTLGPPERARALLWELADLALVEREHGHPQDAPIAAAVQAIKQAASGPNLLIEPSDNIGGGTPGDGTGALRALLEAGVGDIVAVINDPEAAAACHRAGPGASLDLSLGGKVDGFHGQPLALHVRVSSVSDGAFALEDPHSHLASITGTRVDMGACATVVADGATVLITSHKTPPMDLGQLRSQGIDPLEAHAIVVKAAVAHRQAYDPIAAASYYAETPGLGTSNLRSLPYANARRPLWPLDDPFDTGSR